MPWRDITVQPGTWNLERETVWEKAGRVVDLSTQLERERLVRLCATITGDAGVAEDLAQETLLEAWRHERRLRDPERRPEWLTGIARNVCRRWRRRYGQERARVVLPPDGEAARRRDPTDQIADGVDLEVDLERAELAELLDRAMALLPPATRAALVLRYVEDSPLAEIAARMGMTEGAVKVRLHRGRLALSRLLTTDLADEAAAYGLVDGAATGWQETDIWCPTCAARRLRYRFNEDTGMGSYRCPSCCQEPEHEFVSASQPRHPRRWRSLPGLFELLHGNEATIAHALRHPLRPCPSCHRSGTFFVIFTTELSGPERPSHGFVAGCRACNLQTGTTLEGLGFALPAVQQFWRAHPRLHMPPDRVIEADGGPAAVVRFESATDNATLDTVWSLATFELLGVHQR